MEIGVLSLKLESTKVPCYSTVLGMVLIRLLHLLISACSCLAHYDMKNHGKVYQDVMVELFVSFFRPFSLSFYHTVIIHIDTT